MWVFDASPLIYLGKAGRLGKVRHLQGDCLVPERVHEEVVERGLEHDYADARRVQQHVEEDVLSVREATGSDWFETFRDVDALSDADAAVLALTAAVDGTAVMDEATGREVAAVEGVETRGTAYLVVRLVAQGAFSADEGRETIDAMLDAGWYCAPDLYAKIRRKLDALD